MSTRPLSKSAKKILKFLQKNPHEQFHVNEIIRRTKILPRSVTLALKRLENEGYIKSERIGNIRLIKLNSEQIVTTPSQVKVINHQANWAEIDCYYPSFIAAYCANSHWQESLVQISAWRREQSQQLQNTSWYDSLREMQLIDQDFISKLSELTSDSIRTPGWARQLTEQVTKIEKQLLSDIKSIPGVSLTAKTNGELIHLLTAWKSNYQQAAGTYLALQIFIYILPQLIKHSSDRYEHSQIEILANPSYLVDYQYLDQLSIAQAIKNGSSYQEISQLLSAYLTKYAANGDTELWRELTLHRNLKQILADHNNPDSRAQELINRQKHEKSQILTILDEISADLQLRELTWLLQEVHHLAKNLQDSLVRSEYVHDFFATELTHRIKIGPIELKLLTTDEMTKLLRDNGNLVAEAEIAKQIAQRSDAWAIFNWENKRQFVTSTYTVLEKINQYQATTHEIKYISGNMRNPGRGSGLACMECGDAAGEVVVARDKTELIMANAVYASAVVVVEDLDSKQLVQLCKELNVPLLTVSKQQLNEIEQGMYLDVDATRGRLGIL